MRLARTTRVALGALLATGWLPSTGCTHNYYYTTPAGGPCAPTAVIPGTAVGSVSPSYGEFCEVPTQVVGGGTVIAGSPVTTTPVLTGPRPPRVVLSDPVGRGRGAWRRPDPESSLATTRVEGGLDDASVTR